MTWWNTIEGKTKIFSTMVGLKIFSYSKGCECIFKIKINKMNVYEKRKLVCIFKNFKNMSKIILNFGENNCNLSTF